MKLYEHQYCVLHDVSSKLGETAMPIMISLNGFDFTPYAAGGPWRFIELHLGYDYRAFVMFPNGRLEAYWKHLFKKPGQKVPPKEIGLAKSRAIDCWNTIQGRY